MAELPFFSSQGSQYDQDQLSADKENVASSPFKPSSPSSGRVTSTRTKKPPTVTPKRFTRFFTPRVSLQSRSGRQSKAGRQLRDITKNGANRRRLADTSTSDLFAAGGDQSITSSPPAKRRRLSSNLQSSPPPPSSPLKHIQQAQPIHILEDAVSSPPAVDDEDALSKIMQDMQPFQPRIRRARQGGSTMRTLQRSFGGSEATSRGRRGTDHGVHWQAETANFVSEPSDVHRYSRRGVPFCITGCNTNSLVAVGDEEGSIRLLDTSATADFSKPHVTFRAHRNAVMDIAFSSDDYLLATAGGDQTGRIVDMHTQTNICVLSGHHSSLKQIRFQPGNDHILTTSSRDGTVSVWDLRCSERGSMSSLSLRVANQLNEDGVPEPSVRYAKDILKVGPAHRPTTLQSSDEVPVSITAIQHLPQGREHLLLTAGECNASVKLWDLRSAGRRNATPILSSPLPARHIKTRNWGISSMVLSRDGTRLYTLCKDASVHTYTTNSLIAGCAPANLPSTSRRAHSDSSSSNGLAPLYSFKHPLLRPSTFFVKAALRPARGDKSEMLAVGSSDGSPILIPTDERHLHRPEPHYDDEDEDETTFDNSNSDSDENTFLPPKPRGTPLRRFLHHEPTSASGVPEYTQGTPLVRGHSKEANGLAWSSEGALVTISDDFTARCWREDAEKARYLRHCGEGGGLRWGHGWADVEGSWDEEEV